ncbi:CHAD domain-containing protein [Georgenia subflava]|nr:CHAD domain-containing protein [Georgenia subflava]
MRAAREVVCGVGPEVEPATRPASAAPTSIRRPDRRARAPSRAVGDAVPRRPGPDREASPDSPASEVVLGYVDAQLLALRQAQPGVVADSPDAVHQMRVAARRLRSTLKTFRALFDREPAERLREELRWLGTVLGDARDAEVMHARLRDRLAADPVSNGRAAVLGRIDSVFDARRAQARKQVLRELGRPRHLRLLDDLEAFVAEPPLTGRAAHEASKELPGRAHKAWRTVRRRHREVDGATGAGEPAGALHEVRKAAKRARYAGEALEPVFGRDAERFAAAMEEIQDVLGAHQDGHLAREAWTALAAQAHAAGENTFHYGRLAAQEEAGVEAARREYRDAWRAATRKRLHAWTR